MTIGAQTPDAPNGGGPTSTIGAVRFNDLTAVDARPANSVPAHHQAVDTDSYLNQLADEPRNNGFVTALADRRRARRMRATRRGFLRSTIAAGAAAVTVSTVNLFGPSRKVDAQSGVVGSYPRRILQFCPPYNSSDNCQPGCGSSPICTDCCGSDGFFRNDPANGYTLYAGGCGDGDIADGWVWRYEGVCGTCSTIEYRCSDGYVQTDTGPAPFICRAVTDCVPLADGQEPGPNLRDAARDTNWRPAGALEVAIDNGGSVSIRGWIADGSGDPVSMRITANGSIIHFGTAALPRADVQRSLAGAGPNTGFAVTFPEEPGQYRYCVDALGASVSATIGCVNLNVGSGGSVRGSGSTGSISPAPATDPDAPAATAVPEAVVLPELASPSAHLPYGAVQVIRRSGDTTGFASGWAGDADTDDPTFIEVTVDGESAVIARAELPRADVAAAIGGMSSTTGFAVSFPVPEGEAEVCVDAIGPDDGRRRPLGCRVIGATAASQGDETGTPPAASGSTSATADVVYGAVDDFVEIGPGQLEVRGWALDPNDRDRAVAIEIRSPDATSSGGTGLTHRSARSTYGASSAGFAITIELDGGPHTVEVHGISVDGSTTILGSGLVFEL